ncbi:MAG: hypothetical protein ACKOTD_07620 [Phycisphaerales bacterium]
MKSLVALAAVAGSVGVSSLASAAIIFNQGTETGSRYNAQANPPIAAGYNVATTTTFTSCVFDGGNNSAVINRLTFGIRQLAGAPSVDIRVFIAQMTGDGTLNTGSVQDLGLLSIGGVAASATTQVSLNLTAGLKIAMTDLAPANNPGKSGFFVGLRFEGANAANNLNGWRITNAPSVGLAFNNFASYDPTSGLLGYYSFAAPTPSYMFLNVDGTLVPAPGALALLGLAGIAGSRRRR